MGMTRKHFVGIARAIRDTQTEHNHSCINGCHCLTRLAHRLCGLFYHDNPQFNMNKFLIAAEIGAVTRDNGETGAAIKMPTGLIVQGNAGSIKATGCKY